MLKNVNMQSTTGDDTIGLLACQREIMQLVQYWLGKILSNYINLGDKKNGGFLKQILSTSI